MKSHILGYPRIGVQRELKWALEQYWAGQIDQPSLLQVGAELRLRHWQAQADAGLDFVSVGDFAWYDQVLNHSLMFGVISRRFGSGRDLDTYFRMARGRAPCGCDAAANDMTKWFDTNYHYLVPELADEQVFSLDATDLLAQIREAQQAGFNAKPVLIGPLTYLWLAVHRTEKGASEGKLALLPHLLDTYGELLALIKQQGIEWLQIDEPILALDLPQSWKSAFELAYNRLNSAGLNVLLATYFGPLGDNLGLTCQLPTAGLHVDLVRGPEQLDALIDRLPVYKVLSLGLVNGRNVWRTDLRSQLALLQSLPANLKQRVWVSASCSLLHSPMDVSAEHKWPAQQKNWFAFARQKLDEIVWLSRAAQGQLDTEALVASDAAISDRARSGFVHNPAVQAALQGIQAADARREQPYAQRAVAQHKRFNLPLLPTTTIGSFPQTKQIRAARKAYKEGVLDQAGYAQAMRAEIAHVIRVQQSLGLDVLVHGEAERNDMVEYFGEQLEGYLFSQQGWVQSYGSRCVKPPIIAGDISRPVPMTVQWAQYAQSLSLKPVKGMLTGPITMLCWSFPRDDISREQQALQIALALRAEVQDLEAAGIGMIQVDEPAIREGLPLRRADWPQYLRWAVQAFKLSTCVVADHTQIHTHMCYSEFNDIIQAIADLDADVITIETSRSNMELLSAFERFAYPNEIGPGVYDIHSPVVPDEKWMGNLLETAARAIPLRRLWVNPDCGLKTRGWPETEAALRAMVNAAHHLRQRVQAGAEKALPEPA
ncbi:MAG: 5-methyltetrahydropteroyltriglutamate--homocysteine S-methyltransferase [Oceanospirillaceae bacterium]|nr:5-methyltetrahydropteroyltriglutamate--homocysteine S-methyltransferase [Oceanospirillaceae bacterium]